MSKKIKLFPHQQQFIKDAEKFKDFVFLAPGVVPEALLMGKTKTVLEILYGRPRYSPSDQEDDGEIG